jgi:long-chain acyl-CoA synthetase
MTNVASAYQIFDLDHNDSLVSVLPLHHTFEATAGFLFPLYAGCSITYARSLKSKELMEDIKNSHTSLMVGVPLLYEKMYEGIRRSLKKLPLPKKVLVNVLYQTSKGAAAIGKRDLGKVLFKSLREKAGLDSVKYFVSGGAALPPYIPEFFNLLGITLFQGYGLTETAPVLTVNPVGYPKHSSVGIPIPGVEVIILEPDSNGIGEIAAKGANVFSGYYKDEEAVKGIFHEDWFRTGDLGWIDDEGYVYITGRKKNMLVTGGGKNVYPEEIEALLNKQPHILESLVLGVPRPGGMGEEVEAIIVPDYEVLDKEAEENGISWTEEMIEAVIREEVMVVCSKLAEYKKVKRFSVQSEEFVKTSTKKIKRYLYQQKYLEIDGNKK